MSDLSLLIWLLILFGVAGILATTCVVLARGALAGGAVPAVAIRIAATAGAALLLWLALAIYLGSREVFLLAPGEAVPWIGVALAGVLAGVLLASRIPAVSVALAGPDSAIRLVAPQMFRVVGVSFVIVMLLGELPPLFALPAGLGDIAVGVAAALLVYRARRGQVRRTSLVWFNVLGLADLVVAIGLGFLAAPGAYQLITGTPSTEAMVRMPLVLVPTVAVPVAVALHLLSLRRLARANLALGEGSAGQPQGCSMTSNAQVPSPSAS